MALIFPIGSTVVPAAHSVWAGPNWTNFFSRMSSFDPGINFRVVNGRQTTLAESAHFPYTDSEVYLIEANDRDGNALGIQYRVPLNFLAAAPPPPPPPVP